MKKFITLAAILAALTLTVTACSNKDDNSSTGSDAGTTTSEAGTQTAEPGIVGDETAQAGTTTSEAGATTPDAGASDAETTALDAYQMAANVYTAFEWPAMMEIPDAETTINLFSIDLGLCEDYYIAQQLMSAHLNQVIICKPAAGKEAELQAQFDAHFAYIKDGAAFYPEQEASAAGAVQGKTDDGYLYIIVHANAADAEAALQNNPPAEMPEAYARVEIPFTAEADDGIA